LPGIGVDEVSAGIAMRILRRFVERHLASFGLELRRRRLPHEMCFAAQGGWPKTILDIGANAGQFARQVVEYDAKCVVHCFEPLTQPFHDLSKWAGGFPNVHCHNVALGERAGEFAINTGDFTASSSLYEPTDRLTAAMPSVVPSSRELIRVTTLDEWASEYTVEAPFVIKMDVQGYELQVIRGGRNTFGNASAVLSEVSFVELYKSQPLVWDLVHELHCCGFEMADICTVSRDPGNGLGFQFDALFIPRRYVVA
jgi:FkbM family methyltransferase